jgi:hypothetical protein
MHLAKSVRECASCKMNVQRVCIFLQCKPGAFKKVSVWAGARTRSSAALLKAVSLLTRSAGVTPAGSSAQYNSAHARCHLTVCGTNLKMTCTRRTGLLHTHGPHWQPAGQPGSPAGRCAHSKINQTRIIRFGTFILTNSPRRSNAPRGRRHTCRLHSGQQYAAAIEAKYLRQSPNSNSLELFSRADRED